MTKITLYCQGAAARAKVEGSITAGAVGIPVEVVCDSTWDGLTRTLICMSADRRVPIVLGSAVPTVAWETLIAGMHLYLGLEGRNSAGDIVIPTTWADCGRVQPSAEGSHTGLPTPTEMEQLLMLAASAGEDGRKALELCETLKNTLVSSADVEQAVANWLASHGDTLSSLSAAGAAANQVPMAEGNGTWNWKALPNTGAGYDDTALRNAIAALETGKMDLRQSPQDSGKVMAINETGILVPVHMSASGTLPDNAVLYEEDDSDLDAQTLEALLADKLTLESDGEFIYLLCGDAELGRVEAASGGSTVYCTGIAIGEENVTLDAGTPETCELSVSVTPSDCTQNVRWSSSDIRVAEVSNSGVVTAVDQGTAVITAKCGTHTASVTIHVIRKQRSIDIVLGGIELSGTTALRNTTRNDRASSMPLLMYVGEGAKITVRCSSPNFYFGPTGYLLPDVETDITENSAFTSGRISDPGWCQGEYTVTANGWTHLAVNFRYGGGSVFTEQVIEQLKNALTIEVE